MKPACMDEREYTEWMVLNKRALTHRTPSPCDDCTDAFAAEMRAEDRCDGTPGNDKSEPVFYDATAQHAKAVAAANAAKRARREAAMARAAELMDLGRTNGEIARIMVCSPNTISSYRRALRRSA